MSTLKDLKELWEDNPIRHEIIKNTFDFNVNGTPFLKEHRDWVEANAFGFGERCFHWLHFLLVLEMPKEYTFMEIGVFRFQTISLQKLIAGLMYKKVNRIAITPLDSSDGHWESDYAKDGEIIHDQFELEKDYIVLHGKSQDVKIIEQAKQYPCDILYVDGDHSYAATLSDLRNYHPILKVGGYLLVDDACNDMKMPWGFFQGIQAVTDATLDFMAEYRDKYEFIGSVVHNRLYRKISD